MTQSTELAAALTAVRTAAARFAPEPMTPPEYLHALAALHDSLSYADEPDDCCAEKEALPAASGETRTLRPVGVMAGGKPSPNVSYLYGGEKFAHATGAAHAPAAVSDDSAAAMARAVEAKDIWKKTALDRNKQLIEAQDALTRTSHEAQQAAQLADRRHKQVRSLRDDVQALEDVVAEKNGHAEVLDSRINEQRSQLAHLNKRQSNKVAELTERAEAAEKAVRETEDALRQQMMTDAKGNLELNVLRGIIGTAFPKDQAVVHHPAYVQAWDALRQYGNAIHEDADATPDAPSGE